MISLVTTLPLNEERATLNLTRRASLGLIVISIAFSISGTLLLRLFPDLIGYFGPYYEALVKAPTWTYMAALPVAVAAMYLPLTSGRAVTLFLIWGALIGGGSELLGTTTGFPFGAYSYTFWLGPQAFGHVPYFIPLSWFALSLLSYDLAGRVATSRWSRVLATAVIMTLWDVSLDPAMSRAFPFWVYPDGGFFYGMPLSNWFGWLLVSAIIALGFDVVAKGRPPRAESARWVYALNCAFPIALSLAYGLWGAVLAGLAATALVLWGTRNSVG